MNASNKQTVLIVDDMRTNALALAKILSPEWGVQTVLDGESALRMAAQDPMPNLILLDVKMPSMDGYEVCRRLKQSEKTRDIPVMFITALDDLKDEMYGLELGAVDYILKPINGPIVKARVRNHIALQQAHSDLALKNEELEQIAIRDKLTGLYNRRKLDESFVAEVSRAERYGRSLSAIMIDIDHFKAVNDAHGHSVGDAVLAETASRLHATLRTSDILGRWGGEEFLIICPETSLETAGQLAERLRLDYEDLDFPVAGRLTASFGVVAHRPGHLANDILLRADKALYRAKNEGRNRIEQEK